MFFLDTCSDLAPIIKLLKHGVIPIIQIGIPIILIILGMLDLGKAVVASKEDEIKTAQKLLVKRCIYALAIFFVITIVRVVFGLLASTDDSSINNQSWSTCWDKY